ncbi:Rieske 2Fe-2S domain-containing protein [Actinomadura sp. 7K534]|uniref:Rieske 2Fe-2S domain-containing protein n=1 Tax=Actinomadura sp. 7K534 TaxID=2530366 RepID=UPI0010436268|nr:Rieske 2Fe-2S domain-containing protein [Actinomadura sp. 7K534]TDB98529.1 iron-sulfur protein [Actinomadura sp. 7K534]
MNMPHRTMRRLEEAEALDGIAKPLSKAAQGAVRPRIVRNLLSGAKTGHPLHPPLTDVPIGAWSMSAVLDVMGGPGAEPAADMLVKVGLFTAVPTALSGLNDWSDTIGADRRVGLVHAAANSAALTLYAASAVARARGKRGTGKALGFAGLGMMAIGGYLGGHLSFANGVNVNRTAWEQEPEEWTPVMVETELADGQHRTADANGVEVLLYRKGATIYAMSATCSHMGGPLGEGTIEDDCVTCPWHGSTFRFADGGIERGPASSPQPHFETRIEAGRIEIRLAPPEAPAKEGEGGIHRGHRRPLARTPAS